MKNPFKSTGKMANSVKEAKQQLIATAIVLAACLAVHGIGSFVSDIFVSSGKDTTAQMQALENEMHQFKSTDQAFTGVGQIQTQDDVKVEWVGHKLDTGRYSSDKAAFWEWIRPAFNYNSAKEYNQTLEAFKKDLGECLFTVQFMTNYDIESVARKKYPDQVDANGKPSQSAIEWVDQAYKCAASESDYSAWPIAEESDGSYRYVARIKMGAPGADFTSKQTVVFMFTIQHKIGENGADEAVIRDFECWPPGYAG